MINQCYYFESSALREGHHMQHLGATRKWNIVQTTYSTSSDVIPALDYLFMNIIKLNKLNKSIHFYNIVYIEWT